jgi:cobalt/nickel transport system ATP-binding protein
MLIKKFMTHDKKEAYHPVDADEIVKVSCFTHIFEDKTKIHICGLDFFVKRKEKIAILGPSGSGKTTLLKHLLGLLDPQEGVIWVFGVNPSKDFEQIRSRIGFVGQNVDEQIIASSVFEDICFSPLNYGIPRDETERLAYEIMDVLKITHLKDKAPHYLSGGEKRKVALAGALVLKPRLLILDEPFSGLDTMSKNELVGIINYFNDHYGTAVILTSHDVDIVPEIADFIYLLKAGGEISKRGKPGDIFADADKLAKYRLEPPILSKFFLALKKKMPKIQIPLTIEEAERDIENIIKK